MKVGAIKEKLLKAVLFLAVASMIMVSAGCGSEEQAKSEEQLRIAAQPYPLYTSVYVAHEMGYLKEELSKAGVSYTWNEFKSGPLVNEAVAAGQADLGFMADLPAIIARSSGQDIEVVSNIAYGEKALAVLVKQDSPIQSVKDLAGKKVAYATGSYAQHLLSLLLSNEGLSLSDVTSINLGAGDQGAALASGEVDAIVIWDQYVSKLTTSGEARVLADGTGVKRGNMVNYFVKSYSSAHPEVVAAYIRALDRADELIGSDPQKAASVVAKDFGVDEALMLEILKHFTFTTELSEADLKEIKAVKDFSLANGIIRNDVDMESFINTKYLAEAKK